MAKQTVELAPGESKEISFEAVPAKAKTYSVSVDGLSGSFTATVPVAAGSIVADSWVMDTNPDIAFGSGLHSKLYLYVCGYYSKEMTFIKANLPPPGSEIASAKLRLYYKGYPAEDPAGNVIDIHRVLGNWNEATITWNNMPARSTTIIASQIVPDSFGWMEWDITDEVRYLIEHPDENFGWSLKNPKNTYPRNDTEFYSKEAGINQPYVDIAVGPSLTGRIGPGLIYITNWKNIVLGQEIPLNKEIYLAPIWINDSSVNIVGHVDLLVTYPDGSLGNLVAEINQDKELAPGYVCYVYFQSFLATQEGTYTITATLSSGDQVLDSVTFTLVAAPITPPATTLAGEILDVKWRETGTEEWRPFPVSLPAYTKFDCKWRVRNNSNGHATFTTGIMSMDLYRAYRQTVTTLDPGEEADLIYIGFAGFSAGTSGSQVIYLGALSGTVTETGQQYWYEAELVDSVTIHYSWY